METKMKYLMLAPALSVALATGAASAGEPADDSDTASTPTSGVSDRTSDRTVSNDPEDQAKNVQSVDLLFATDSAELKPSAHHDLVKLAQWAKCTPKGALILEGHADPRGTQAYNMKLSGERAAIVRQQLLQMGVPSDHIVVTIYGKNGPDRSTFAEERRVTVRATSRPVPPNDITASR
jgi:peptidoglycan-associated lipoprotein